MALVGIAGLLLKALLPVSYKALQKLVRRAPVVLVGAQLGQSDLQALGDKRGLNVHDLPCVVPG